MESSFATELDALLEVDLSSLSEIDAVAHVAKIERLRSQVEARVFGVLRSFDESGAWRLDASHSVTNWLNAQTGTSRADAQRRMRLARHLEEMPATAAALLAGEITVEHARILAWCVANPRTKPDFMWHERHLLGEARRCDADTLVPIVRQWMLRIDQDGPEPKAPEPDTLHANRVGDRVKIDGDFGLDTGLPILEALGERSDQLFHRDKQVSEANPLDGLGTRTRSQRAAEALYELVTAGAAAESNPARREPLYNVFVDHVTLLQLRITSESIHELDDASIVPLPTLELWRCGAFVNKVVVDAEHAVLALGRTERYANREQRRALNARDRGCAVPGCDRPPAHCDAHHIVYWDDLGDTDLDNLVLTCRHHHRAVHAGRLRVEMVDRLPRFYDVFGERITAGRRRPPPQVDAA